MGGAAAFASSALRPPYAPVQACGIVNDHLAGCTVRDEVEEERRRAALESSSH
jgi:hypothetical protein